MGANDAALAEISARSGALRADSDLDPLMDRIGDARIVMLGEASHGTSEYYRWRAAITRRLVTEAGFDFVAVEGDWPDCARIDQWVKDRDPELERAASSVLRDFERWPTWMWANEDVAVFIDWLRHHNRDAATHVGFYGLDVYSLWDSLRIVLDHVRDHDPESMEEAEAAWRCFEPYGEDPHRYARAIRL